MDVALDAIAGKMKAIRDRQQATNFEDPEHDHVEADDILEELIRLLADAAGYDVTDILADYDSLMLWYA